MFNPIFEKINMYSIRSIFKWGPGPSSSHTRAPQIAGNRFTAFLLEKKVLDQVTYIQIDFYGSFATTGLEHGSVRAVQIGLEGRAPEDTLGEYARTRERIICKDQQLVLASSDNRRAISFNPETQLNLNTGKPVPILDNDIPPHPNTMTITASYYDRGGLLQEIKKTYISVGGGEVLDDAEFINRFKPKAKALKTEKKTPRTTLALVPVPERSPFDFRTEAELLNLIKQQGLSHTDGASIAEIMLRREEAIGHSRENTGVYLDKIWETMNASINTGLEANDSVLTGSVPVERKARRMLETLDAFSKASNELRPTHVMQRVRVHALAVNEHNASGGTVVTGATNGSAPTLPAILRHHVDGFRLVGKSMETGNAETKKDIHRFLLTAAAILMIYKHGPGFAAATGGCMLEVGTAASAGAAGLCAINGGSIEQIINAAIHGGKSFIGMPCDALPNVTTHCAERNMNGAELAISSAMDALMGYRVTTPEHGALYSLDMVVGLMDESARNMQWKYRENGFKGGGAARAIGRKLRIKKSSAIPRC